MRVGRVGFLIAVALVCKSAASSARPGGEVGKSAGTQAATGKGPVSRLDDNQIAVFLSRAPTPSAPRKVVREQSFKIDAGGVGERWFVPHMRFSWRTLIPISAAAFACFSSFARIRVRVLSQAARWMLSVVVLTMAACRASDDELGRRWEGEVAAAYRDHRPASLERVATFPWDTLQIVVPYMDDERVSKQFGFSWSARGSSSTDQDVWVLMALVKDKRVVRWFDFLRAKGDPLDLGQVTFARSATKFDVVRDPQGRLVLRRFAK